MHSVETCVLISSFLSYFLLNLRVLNMRKKKKKKQKKNIYLRNPTTNILTYKTINKFCICFKENIWRQKCLCFIILLLNLSNFFFYFRTIFFTRPLQSTAIQNPGMKPEQSCHQRFQIYSMFTPKCPVKLDLGEGDFNIYPLLGCISTMFFARSL